jgi:ABC-type branched-subunit amino acid transport system ATPase component
MALAIFLATEGLITGGMVMAASYLITRSIAPIQKLLGSWKEIVSVRQAYQRLDGLLEDDPSWGEHMDLPVPKGKLEVQHLTARPPGAKQSVLKDINFTLLPGEVLAIVGPSAAGKSTLSRLLVGIWEPEEGHVRLDGADVHAWAKDGLGSVIGYVPQEVEFFEESVGANIARLGEVDPVKVVTATKIVDVHDTILAFPQGYETLLSGSGFALTGGQKQKIAIARALYGLPNYYVFDEPNASLDEKSEAKLLQVILGLKNVGKTVIFSTHRTALLAGADKLLVLDGGRQIAFGPARELLALAGNAEKNNVQPIKQHA